MRLACCLALLLFVAGCQSTGSRVTELHKKGLYSEGSSVAERELVRVEREKGPDHLETAAALNSLAMHYLDLGEFGRAEPLLARALAIRERAPGADDLDVATSLNNLALCHADRGDYARAEPLYTRALAIREKRLDKDHPDIAASLNNLATLYQALGDLNRAGAYYSRAIQSWEKSLGPDDPNLAAALANLGGIHASVGQYGKAEPLLERALDIRARSLGEDHPETGVMANNLAAVYQLEGKQDKAEKLYLRALRIAESSRGARHPDVAFTLANLAALRFSGGDPGGAEALYGRALAILEESLGPRHPGVADTLDDMARVHAARGDFAGAHRLHLKARAIDRELIDQVVGFTSEEEKSRFLAARYAALERSLGLVVQHLASDASARRDALDLWLNRKGMVLETQRRFQEALVGSDNAQAMKAFEDLSRVRNELSRLVFSRPDGEGGGKVRERIARLEAEKEGLEVALGRMSRDFALHRVQFAADSREVARALPPGSVLIEYVRLRMADFTSRQSIPAWKPARYVAFTLPSGEAGGPAPVDGPALVDLGAAEVIDSAVSDLKRSIGTGSDARQVREACARLHALVIEPLEGSLKGSKRLFISTDGNLSLIPFEILSGSDGKSLVDGLLISYLASGRDVVAFGRPRDAGGKALLMGNPAFDLLPGEKARALRKFGLSPAAPTSAAVPDPFGGAGGGLRGGEPGPLKFSPLPATADEVAGVSGILGAGGAEVHTGAEALEEVLLRARGPRILHLATHGFFLTDAELEQVVYSGGAAGRGLVLAQPGVEKKAGEKDASGAMGTQPPGVAGKPAMTLNPLLRSGLALAGANEAIGSQGGGGGILTAEKVLGLNLRGTETVVLSACETGLGELRTGEGVYGLRRAFTQAGARAVVMSMWAVPDLETRELMVRFYENLITRRMSPPEALRLAALEEKEVVRKRHGWPNPLYWGAFVYLGEP